MNSIFRSEAGKQEIITFYRQILERSSVKFRTRKINTGLGETFLLEVGSENQPPLLLLHGTGSNSASWLGDLTRLSESFHVFALDIPGEPGLSSEARPDLNSDGYAQFLNEILQELRLSKTHLTGMSLGGWLALRFAVNFPDKVMKLVLISPSGLVKQKISFLFKCLPLMFMGNYGFKKINRMIYHKVSIPEEAARLGKLISTHFHYRTGIIPLFTDQEMQRIKSPILYFGGDKDVLLDSRRSIARLKQNIPEAETFLLRDTGHLILNKTREIIEFLKK
jgi:pimeloyl-ACP methyl ester carboxylesterase